MARFVTTRKPGMPDTTNMEGAPAFSEQPKLELASILLTSFLGDQFYRTGEEKYIAHGDGGYILLGGKTTHARLVELVHGIPDKQFAAKAAVLARDWGMRSITHVAAAELCACAKGESWLKSAVAKIIQRPDDAAEILGYWLKVYGKPIPNSMKRGIAQGLRKFNDYQIGKYRGETHELKLVDVVNLCHAKGDVIDRLMRGTLETPDTWETAISACGSDQEAKRKTWSRLVRDRRLGYFALLRNLRNLEMLDVVGSAYEQLTDAEAIRRSKVLPFRYMTALKEVSFPRTIAAISDAVELSLGNLPEFEGRTLVALDVSGSMSSANVADTASLFAAALFKRNVGNCDVLMFGDSAVWARLNPNDSLTTLADKMPNRSQGTDFNLIFDTAVEAYDRVVILSDMQAWMSRGSAAYNLMWQISGSSVPTQALKDYRKRTGADPAIWSIDLAGYGTLQMPEHNVYALAGFSEKLFDLVPMLESGGKDGLIKAIERVSLF